MLNERIIAAALALALGACDPDDGPPPTPLDEIIEDYEDGVITRDELRAELDDYEDSGLPSDLTEDFAITTLLKDRGAPYTIGADLRVAPGVILVVQEGVEIVLGPEVNLTVEGRLYAIGSDQATVVFRAEAPDHYGEIELQSGPNQLVWVELDRGDRNIDVRHPPSTHTLVEDVRFDAWLDVAVSMVDSSNLHILRGRFGYQTAEADVSGETIRGRRMERIIVEQSSFNYRRGYRDVIDLQDCVGDQWPIIVHSQFDGGEDDGVDLDGCSAFVIGNVIRDFQPIDLTAMVGGVNGGGVTGDQVGSKPVIINNIIDNCYHGIGFKNGAAPVIINNTITNSNIGVTLYQSAVGEEMPAGVMINNVLANNAGWLNGGEPQDIVLNGKWWPSYNQVDDVQGTVDARYNITATLPAPYEGEGNLADDPQLEVVDGIPTPAAGSPAVDSGLGQDFGLGPDVPIEQVLEYLATDAVGTARDLATIDRGAVERP